MAACTMEQEAVASKQQRKAAAVPGSRQKSYFSSRRLLMTPGQVMQAFRKGNEMRRLVTALASLAVVSMLVPSIGLAIEAPVENGVGVLCIFTGEDLASADNVIPVVTAFVPYDLYFVLYNEQITSNNLGGVEFAWRFDPVVSPAILARDLPANALNIGTDYNVIMGFGSGLVTTDNHVRVLHYQLMFLAPLAGPTSVYLEPTVPASIAGEMAYNDFNNPADLRVLKPNSVDGLYTNPVFGLNMTIATESETWGGVKALFR